MKPFRILWVSNWFPRSRLPFVLIGGAIAVYLIGVLPQYWNVPFNYDSFYTFWRGQKALTDPLSIFQPNFALRFHPLHILFVSWMYGVFGLNPIVYGLTNGLFHILNALLLFQLARLIRIPDLPAALISFFFLFFSTQWGILWDMEQLARLACIFFYLLSVNLFLRFLLAKGKACFFFSWISFAVSLGFSEDSITLPLLLAVFTPFLSSKSLSSLKGFVFTLPFFFVALAYGLFSVQAGTPQGWHLNTGAYVPLNFLCLINEYLHFLFIPRSEFVSFLPFPSVFSRLVPAVLIFLFFLAVLNLKKDRIRQIIKEDIQLSDYSFLIFGLLWVLITASVYCLRPMSYVWQGRYLYLPGMGISMIAGPLIHKIGTSLKSSDTRLSLARSYFLKFSFLGILIYLWVLNVATTLGMVHKTVSTVNAATKEELPAAFFVVGKIRDQYGAPLVIPRNVVLIVEGLPIPIPRLKELLLTYYSSLPRAIIEAKEVSGIEEVSRDGTDEILYLKWRDPQRRKGHFSERGIQDAN